ncbi:MAG TPA: hypothetical protein VLB03_05745, partial [Nocardioidaceae bacterium]|nr:hypothetical protein [Nocardioidaceae bacterium]
MLAHPVRVLAGAVTALALAGALTVALSSPAAAHGDRERVEKMRTEYSAGMNVPLLTSPNVNLVASDPGSAGISGCFTKTAPLFVMSNLDSIKVYDVSDPLKPTLTGTLPSLQFENEAMNCGERRTGTGTARFALIGVDLYQASPDDIEHVNDPATGSYELIVVDVTDPANPRIRSRVPGTTSTHTVACVAETDCRYAYSAGSGTSFSIFDLTDLDHPVEVDADPAVAGVQPFSSPTAGHKWNFDAAGFATHTGWGGSGMFDVSDPRNPELVTTTGAAGRGEDPEHAGYNDFIHHNSFRPNAAAFKPDAEPSFANGNVLLVTEEDYEQTDCTKAGSFQTWWVKRLDGTPDAIVPLDKVELADLGTFPVPQYAFCSAHWFDYHPSGIVSVGFYGGGTQFVDVRKPRDIKAYGHATWGVSEVWDAYWVPRYTKDGLARGKTNLAYSVDAVRGLDVYRVALPGNRPAAVSPALGSTNPFAVFSWPEDA